MSMTRVNPTEFEYLGVASSLSNTTLHGHPTWAYCAGYTESDSPNPNKEMWGYAITFDNGSIPIVEVVVAGAGAWTRYYGGSPSSWTAWRQLNNN